MIVTSVQIKTVKTQKHLYCPVFTRRNGNFRKKIAVSLFFAFQSSFFSFVFEIVVFKYKSTCNAGVFSMKFTLPKTAERPYPPFLTLMCKIFIAQGAI